jgi:folate-binding protein YgfZ
MNSPIHPLHEAAEAEFQAYADISIVQTFGEPQAEYAAVRKSAAIFDFPQRGIIEATGKDRLPFLNNMLTNQTWDKQTKTPMAAGAGVYAFFLNRQGRIFTDMTILEQGDRTLIELEARMVAPLKAALEKYLFSEQVKLTSKVGGLHQFFIQGPSAAEAISRAAGTPVGEMGQLSSMNVKIADQDVIAYRDDVAGVPGYMLIVSIEGAEAIWNVFTRQSDPSPAIQELKFTGLARPAGWAAFNTSRIEAGRPLFGIDFDETILPAETGQFSRAVSLTKGCYLGQEIVARMHARGQIAKQIVGLRMEGDALPIAGAKVHDDQQNEVGGITSSTVSPILSNAAIALALLKKPFFTPSTKVSVLAEGAIRTGIVTALPFIR